MNKKTTSFIYSIFLTILLLSSCSFAPSYKRPNVDMSQNFKGGSLHHEEVRWEDYFKDTELNNLIGLAIANNKSLRATSYKVEQARAMYGIKSAAQLPTLGISGGLNRVGVPDSLSSSPYVPNYLTTYQATLGISSWELDFWGRLSSLKKVALENYMASLEAKKAVELTIVTQVANSYLYQKELQERLGLTRKSLKLRQKSYDLFKRSFKVGSISKLEVTQGRLLLNQAKSELVLIKRELDKNKNALRVLVGTNLPRLTDVGLSSVESYFTKEIPSGVPSELLQNRPDIIGAEHRLRSANANIGAAKAAFFPSISLTGAYGQGSRDLSDLFDSSNGGWIFRPSISIPIFTGGLLSNQLKASKAARKEAVAQYEGSIETAFREVSDVLAQRRWIKEQLDIQLSTLKAQKERSEISKLRYKAGATNYFEVLDSERNLFAVEQSMVQIRRAYLSSSVALFSAIGGQITKVINNKKQVTDKDSETKNE